MNLFDAIQRRRSIREFKPGGVPESDVTKILEAGRLAPSGCNLQNREFIVIRDRDTIAKLSRIQDSFENVPVVIAVVMTPTATSFGSYWVEDCAACVENMLLAVAGLGYASVWIEGTLVRHEGWAKALLGVPADKRLYVMLPVGHAAAPAPQPARRPLPEITYLEKYGQKARP